MSGIPGSEPDGEELDLGEIEETEGDDGEAGGDADEPSDGDGADAEGGEEGEEGERSVAQPRQGRKSQTQRWRDRAEKSERELQEFRSQTERQFGELRGQLANDPSRRAREEEQEREFIARSTPEEVSRYFLEKGRREFGAALASQEYRIHERLDKQAYETAARNSTVHRRYQARVEELVQSERAAGRNPDRETVLSYLIGEDVKRRAGEAAPRQRRAAGGRVAAQQAKPGGGRSDAAAARRPAGDSYEASLERLKGQPIW